MLSLQFIREHPHHVRKALTDRQTEGPLDEVLELDERRRVLLGETEQLRAEQNAAGKRIGAAKDPAERQRMIDEMKGVSGRLDELEPELRGVDERLQSLLLELPIRARRTGRPNTTTPWYSSTARNTGTTGGSPTTSSARRWASSTSSAG